MRRRAALGALMGATLGALVKPELALGRTPDSADLTLLDLTVDGDRRLARRALVLVPKGAHAERSMPILVLLHGLGETGNEMAGIHAWGDRYGLVRAFERLVRPPVVAEHPRLGYLTDERAARINADLRAAPLRPPIMVCPVTPNPGQHASPSVALDRYAAWLHDTLLPAVVQRVPAADLRAVGLDGCSLGGYVALETFLRHPSRVSTIGTVQAAFGQHRAAPYAERIARALSERPPIPLHIQTSTRDPYRRANEQLVVELAKREVMAVLDVIPGPHDQTWLREVGTLEMLRWQSRALASVRWRELASGGDDAAGSRGEARGDARVRSRGCAPGSEAQPKKSRTAALNASGASRCVK